MQARTATPDLSCGSVDHVAGYCQQQSSDRRILVDNYDPFDHTRTMPQFIDSQGQCYRKNSCWEFRFDCLQKEHMGDLVETWTTGVLHCNYAEMLGEALYKAHKFIQHNRGIAPDHYVIKQIDRIPRVIQDGEVVLANQRIAVTEWPAGNPVIPNPNKATVHPVDMPFFSDVPRLTKSQRRKRDLTEQSDAS